MELPFECIKIEPSDDEDIYLATSLNTSHVKCAIFHACGITNVHGKGSRKYKKEIINDLEGYMLTKERLRYDCTCYFTGYNFCRLKGDSVYIEDDFYTIKYRRENHKLQCVYAYNGKFNDNFLKGIRENKTYDMNYESLPVLIVDKRSIKTK